MNPDPTPDADEGRWQVVLARDPAAAGRFVYAVRTTQRQKWQDALAARGVQTGIHYPFPVHLLPAFADLGYQPGQFPHAERAANEVLSLADGAPGLRERIVPDLPDLMVEVVVAARLEQAQSLGDVFLRRTRLGLLAASSVCSDDVARRVAVVLGEELGWDDSRLERELSAWQEEAAAEGIALSSVAAG